MSGAQTVWVGWVRKSKCGARGWVDLVMHQEAALRDGYKQA